MANIDPELCARVAEGLGLEAPAPTVELLDLPPSPALSQVGGSWPSDGRMVGIIVDAAGDLGGVEELATSISEAGMVPLVVAAHGGKLPNGTTVQRTFNATRSVEYDAVVVAGCPAPGPDALPGRDTKAGEASGPDLDPRVALILDECLRHSKAIAAWGAGTAALTSAGIDPTTTGVVVEDDASGAFEQLSQLMAGHRVWERFSTTVA